MAERPHDLIVVVERPVQWAFAPELTLAVEESMNSAVTSLAAIGDSPVTGQRCVHVPGPT